MNKALLNRIRDLAVTLERQSVELDSIAEAARADFEEMGEKAQETESGQLTDAWAGDLEEANSQLSDLVDALSELAEGPIWSTRLVGSRKGRT